MSRDIQEQEIYNEQKYSFFDFKNYKLPKQKQKVDFAFQDLGLELQKYFQTNIWWIFFKPYAKLENVREAFKICQKRGIKNVRYFIGILKKFCS